MSFTGQTKTLDPLHPSCQLRYFIDCVIKQPLSNVVLRKMLEYC